MRIFHSVEEVRAASLEWRRSGGTVALVPTMGFLHEGHLSLMRIARRHADRVVVSVFVNPTQFGPNEDFDRYPRDFAHDEAACESAGVDGVFYPTPEAMYAPDHSCWVQEDSLSRTLCGVTRPVHFRGVCTVCLKLFNICQCQVAVFGKKDAQQALIIRRMVRDLNVPVEIVLAPLVREADGLAMSSRNKYLGPEERRNALALSRGVFAAERLFAAGERDARTILKAVRDIVEPSGGRIDYIELMSRRELRPVARIDEPALLALAVCYGSTRLIDNAFLDL